MMSPTGLTALSSNRLAKRQRGGALALEPGFSSAGGQVFQRIAATHRRLEPTAEPSHRLDPAAAVDAQSLQDRGKLAGISP